VTTSHTPVSPVCPVGTWTVVSKNASGDKVDAV